MSSGNKKIVLAYSGGLDTSVILCWLKEKYNYEVVTFTADIGQGEEIEPARDLAKKLSVKEIFIEDLKEDFTKNYVFPMFRANTVYEGEYLLGTAIARPLIAKRQIEIAKEVNASSVCHGATGKGNDQVRFELSYYSLNPDIKVIAPWREWDLNSRKKLIEYAKSKGISIGSKSDTEPPYSMDANLLHISYEGKDLEDPWEEAKEDIYRRSVSIKDAPDKEEYIEIEFNKGDPTHINGKKLSPSTLLNKLNELGGKHGIGRTDIVENRYVGIKSRGVYETPGGTILLKARRAIESITLDREASHLKDELMPRYAELIYNGYWWSQERYMLQSAIDRSQESVSGIVRVKLLKGNVIITGRKSEESLYSKNIATFEEDEEYNQKDAEGFIKLNALRLKLNKKK